jgi:outer membrane protein assembly factor BamB
VVASVDGSIKAFDAVDGRLIWDKTFGRGVRDLQVVREGVNFVIALFDHGHVVKMDAMTGSVEWETPTPEE